MANILGIFTAIILAVAAFVAMKNNARFEEEISSRDVESRNLEKSQARLKAAQEVLRQLPIERAEVDAQFAAKSEEETSIQESNEALKSEIEEKTSKIASNRGELDEIREKIAGLGNIQDLADTMRNKRVELEELDTTITNNEATLANLTARGASVQADATRRKEELDTLQKGQSIPSLKTRIRNIYPAWGFVTLADGNNAGVVANSALDVVRGNEVVARLLVTGVENSSASASIIPDSIDEGVTLMVGDQVVPGSKAAEKPAKN